MRATILVLETPYFAVTDPEGKFRIEGVPDGEHVLKYKLGRKIHERKVSISSGQTSKLNLGR